MQHTMEFSRARKIFIIEDNDMQSIMMDYQLSKENNFNIFRFKSGEDSLKRLNINPDIIILDYGLPGINGMETFTRIKRQDPEVPIVVMTENKDSKLRYQFLEKGVYDYILKGPDSFQELNRAVDSVLSTLSIREHKANRRISLFVIGGFIITLILSTVISYITMHH